MSHDSSDTTTAATKRALKPKERFGGYLLESKALLDFAVKRLTRPDSKEPQRRFVLFGRGRSGSTLLVRMLDQHSDIECLGEILRCRVMRPQAYVDHCLGALSAPVAGFKLLSYQLREILELPAQPSGNAFLKHLQAQGYRIVYTRRSNLFRHALSNLYAQKRRTYHQDAHSASTAASTQVVISPREMVEWMSGSERLDAYEQAALHGVEHLELIYERDLETPGQQDRTLSRVMAYLGVDAQRTIATLARTTPRDISQFIDNHEELLRELRKTRFATHIDARA